MACVLVASIPPLGDQSHALVCRYLELLDCLLDRALLVGRIHDPRVRSLSVACHLHGILLTSEGSVLCMQLARQSAQFKEGKQISVSTAAACSGVSCAL
jgi:hypothetical protein